jgi:hypothetical protein
LGRELADRLLEAGRTDAAMAYIEHGAKAWRDDVLRRRLKQLRSDHARSAQLDDTRLVWPMNDSGRERAARRLLWHGAGSAAVLAAGVALAALAAAAGSPRTALVGSTLALMAALGLSAKGLVGAAR